MFVEYIKQVTSYPGNIIWISLNTIFFVVSLNEGKFIRLVIPAKTCLATGHYITSLQVNTDLSPVTLTCHLSH